MEYRFNAVEWGELSAADRARRCRLMANEAHQLASAANGSLKESYVVIAKGWERLALDIERSGQSPS